MQQENATKSELFLIRKKLGLTQKELAEILGYNRSYLAKIECGAVPLSEKLRAEISQKCNKTNIGDFCGAKINAENFAVGSNITQTNDKGKSAKQLTLAELSKQIADHAARIAALEQAIIRLLSNQ